MYLYSNRDSSFTQMTQWYGMGGVSVETSPQKMSQSLLESPDYDVGKKGKRHRVNYGPCYITVFPPCIIQ